MNLSDSSTLLLVLTFGWTTAAAEPPMAAAGGMPQAPECASAPMALTAGSSSLSAASAAQVPSDLKTLLDDLYPMGRILFHDATGVTLLDAGRKRLIGWDDLPSKFAPEGHQRAAPAATWQTPAPGYPFVARKQRVMGTLVIVVRTDGEGRVIASAVAVPLHPDLDAHVLKFARDRWTGPPDSHRTVELVYRLVD